MPLIFSRGLPREGLLLPLPKLDPLLWTLICIYVSSQRCPHRVDSGIPAENAAGRTSPCRQVPQDTVPGTAELEEEKLGQGARVRAEEGRCRLGLHLQLHLPSRSVSYESSTTSQRGYLAKGASFNPEPLLRGFHNKSPAAWPVLSVSQISRRQRLRGRGSRR